MSFAFSSFLGLFVLTGTHSFLSQVKDWMRGGHASISFWCLCIIRTRAYVRIDEQRSVYLLSRQRSSLRGCCGHSICTLYFFSPPPLPWSFYIYEKLHIIHNAVQMLTHASTAHPFLTSSSSSALTTAASSSFNVHALVLFHFLFFLSFSLFFRAYSSVPRTRPPVLG